MHTKHSPLTPDEYETLKLFLAEGEHKSGMNLEKLDGYFTALICGPELVPPSEALRAVIMAKDSFRSASEVNHLAELLMRFWNDIAATLLEQGTHHPLIHQSEDGILRGNDWAGGFLDGAFYARPGSWDRLLKDKKPMLKLMPIMALAHENDPDPQLRTPPIKPEDRKELLNGMIQAISFVYRFFEPDRRMNALPDS